MSLLNAPAGFKDAKQVVDALNNGKHIFFEDPILYMPDHIHSTDVKEGEYIAITNAPTERQIFYAVIQKTDKGWRLR